VTIDRQEVLNALNPDVLTQLYETMCQLDADESVKVVILTGAGPKAFVAGADMAAMAAMSAGMEMTLDHGLEHEAVFSPVSF